MKKNLARNQLSLTREIPYPNPYIDLMLGEFSRWTRSEEAAPGHKGKWRQEVFDAPVDVPMDLEVGTGNGFHFGHRCQVAPERLLIGLEIKFKPLVQSIRRVVRAGGTNGCMVRYHAGAVDEIFAPEELNNVYIHFPDPWPKKRHFKNRLIQDGFLHKLYQLQKPGSFLEFKTDSRDYFEWALERMQKGPYKLDFFTDDLHKSERAQQNFITQFESLFLRQGLPIYYALLVK
jgi:tRNA (guanine-N7-)-methyltransferase